MPARFAYRSHEDREWTLDPETPLAAPRCVAIRTSGWLCGRERVEFFGDVPLCAEHLNRLHDQMHRYMRDVHPGRIATWQAEDAALQHRRSQRSERTRTVYYLRRSDGLIKIGVTRNIQARIAELQCSAGPLELLASHSGGQAREREAHTLFATHRAFGEWFTPHADLLAHIARVNEGTWPPARRSRRGVEAVS